MAKAPTKAQAETGTKLVRMVRDSEQHPEPHSADVHPDEVEDYRAGGWQEA